MIYLDNAATTLKKPPEVIDAVVKAMTTFGNASRGAYDCALSGARTIYRTREALADLFHCPSSERVIFCSNATEALNIAISGIFREGDHVISTALEHNSVLRPLYRLREEDGVSLSFVKAAPDGTVDYDEFGQLIQSNTRAIVCTHASNLTGNRLDLVRIGRIAAEHGLHFIVDASQTAGAARIDMEQMNISVLCFTGHKSLMGPQGTGGLCIRGDVEIRPLKTGGTGVQSYLTTQPPEYPTRLEAGTLNGHGIAGLGAAVDFIKKTGVDVIEARERALAKRFREGVSTISDIRLYGDFSTDERSPIVSLNIGEIDSALVSDELSFHYGIATRPGAHCAPRMHEALGTTGQGVVRFSFGYYNTEEEVDAAIAALREIRRDAALT